MPKPGEETIPFLDLVGQNLSLKEELTEVFLGALDGARFIGGAEVEAFEEEFAGYVGARFSVGVASGTDALRFALMAMGIGPESIVITVPNTFIATTEAISQAGARFEFVDVDEETCLMEPNRLEDLLKRLPGDAGKGMRPKCIVPVHLFGQCADMDPILELAERYELDVLEDAAQAHGARYRGARAGSLGTAGAFSFYPSKNLGACGEAGAVTTYDEEIARRVRMIRDHGQQQKYSHKIEGYNGRLDAIQAGFLRVKLKHLDDWNERRRAVAEKYDRAFGDAGWIRPVRTADHNEPVYHLYVIHVPNRDGLMRHLGERSVQTGLHYPVPLHLQECYAHLGYTKGSFPNAERLASELLSLPMYPEMKDHMVDRVIDAVLEFEKRP